MKWFLIIAVVSLLAFPAFANENVSEELLPKDEIVRSINYGSVYGQDMLELKWALSQASWNDQEIFVTVHEGQYKSLARIYVKEDKGYRLIKEIQTELSYFKEPQFIWYKLSDDDRLGLFHIVSVTQGTGYITTESLFNVTVIDNQVALQEIQFTPAPQLLDDTLDKTKGEGVWKGPKSDFRADGLFFEFYIWQKGDGNCCPTAGYVKGEYKLENLGDTFDSQWMVGVKSWERFPVPER